MDTGIDFTASKRGESPKFIQVKYSSRPDVPLHALRNYAASISRLLVTNEVRLLIVSGRVEPSRREWAQSEFKITIWDRDDVLRKSKGTTVELELKKLFDDADFEEPVVYPPSSKLDPEPTEPVPADIPSETKGDELRKRLASVPRGKAGATRFEQVCKEIIEYLFGDSLVDPRTQSRTEDKLNIFDIVYRVKGDNNFWTSLTRDFRARVIVFECKNYKGPVGPMQVHTTERYMSVAALRPICLVLSRTKAHKHARVAAHGALRETGKLLVFLDDEIVNRMLKERDTQIEGGSENWLGNGPTEILDQEIYDFLATMPR